VAIQTSFRVTGENGVQERFRALGRLSEDPLLPLRREAVAAAHAEFHEHVFCTGAWLGSHVQRLGVSARPVFGNVPLKSPFDGP
jgi:hypothetical protein